MLLSDKVLDDPRQRKLFKTSDLVELFNLNEPIDGEGSESDRLFRESKSVFASRFSLSKIEEMKKLASTLSKRIIATNVKSTRNEDKETSDSIHERKHDGQNNNLKCNEPHIAEKHLSKNQTLYSQQICMQESPDKDINSIAESDVRRESAGAKNNDIFKNDSELDVASINTANNNLVEKEKSESVLGSNKIESSHACKRKKNKKKKKEKVSAMFEGERVSCLIGRRPGRSDEKEQSILTTDDDYVLKKLFAKSSNYYFNGVLKNCI